VEDQAPPSMYRWSPMRTGWYQPGIAHEAITASASEAGEAPRRPNETRLPGVVVQGNNGQGPSRVTQPSGTT